MQTSRAKQEDPLARDLMVIRALVASKVSTINSDKEDKGSRVHLAMFLRSSRNFSQEARARRNQLKLLKEKT